MHYVVISKQDKITRSGNEGKLVLQSFARMPLYKTFKYINWQNDNIPNCYDKKTAEYALKKYGNDNMYEVRTYASVEKEFQQYINTQK